MKLLMLRDYHGHAYELTGPEDAARRFDEQVEAVMPHGGCGQTLTIGTADQPVLRIDVDIDADRAAMRWLPDSSYASGSAAGAPLTVYESPDTGLCEIPADLAVLDVAAVRQAVIEYVSSRRRPTNVRWQ